MFHGGTKWLAHNLFNILATIPQYNLYFRPRFLRFGSKDLPPLMGMTMYGMEEIWRQACERFIRMSMLQYWSYVLGQLILRYLLFECSTPRIPTERNPAINYNFWIFKNQMNSDSEGQPEDGRTAVNAVHLSCLPPLKYFTCDTFVRCYIK